MHVWKGMEPPDFGFFLIPYYIPKCFTSADVLEIYILQTQVHGIGWLKLSSEVYKYKLVTTSC